MPFDILSEENGVAVELSDAAKSKIADACGEMSERQLVYAKCVCLPVPQGQGSHRLYHPSLWEELTKTRLQRYDRTGDEHYDCISALHKSLRGSDPDAAVHYLSRIPRGGICRRPAAG